MADEISEQLLSPALASFKENLENTIANETEGDLEEIPEAEAAAEGDDAEIETGEGGAEEAQQDAPTGVPDIRAIVQEVTQAFIPQINELKQQISDLSQRPSGTEVKFSLGEDASPTEIALAEQFGEVATSIMRELAAVNNRTKEQSQNIQASDSARQVAEMEVAFDRYSQNMGFPPAFAQQAKNVFLLSVGGLSAQGEDSPFRQNGWSPEMIARAIGEIYNAAKASVTAADIKNNKNLLRAINAEKSKKELVKKGAGKVGGSPPKASRKQHPMDFTADFQKVIEAAIGR
jgi:hypothetical protein